MKKVREPLKAESQLKVVIHSISQSSASCEINPVSLGNV